MYEVLTPILAFVAIMMIGGGVVLALAMRRAAARRLETDTDFAEEQPAEAAPTQERGGILQVVTSLGRVLSMGRTSVSLGEHLARAGFHSGSAPLTYLGFKIVMLLMGVAISTALIVPAPLGVLVKVYLFALVCGGFFFLPNLVISFRRRRRATEIRQQLPVAIDLLEVCVTAGMGLDTAWNAVSDEVRHVSDLLADEMMLVNLEMQLGSSRTVAMRNMADRTGADELSSLVALLVQTERFGTSVGEALRTFAESMRQVRSMKAEEAAEKLAVKLLFPLVFFIFPVMLIVMAGPAGITIHRVMGT